jgi:hypothetical protein
MLRSTIQFLIIVLHISFFLFILFLISHTQKNKYIRFQKLVAKKQRSSQFKG